MKKPKTKTRTQLKNELDKLFSLYIRHRDNYICVTCGASGEHTQVQCGHYIPRAHLNTRWAEDNCHCQCVGCNVFKKGNMDAYALYMIGTYGAEKLKDLDERKKTIRPWTTKELEEKIAYYKSKVNQQINGAD